MLSFALMLELVLAFEKKALTMGHNK